MIRFVIIKSVVLLSILFSCASYAELTIEITQGRDNPTKIAVVPFAWAGSLLTDDIADIVQNDLYRSGRFSPLPAGDMLSLPHNKKEVFFRDWRALDVEYVVVGNIKKASDGRFTITFSLVDIYREKELYSETYNAAENRLRDVAHKVSDIVWQQLTGTPGAFSTKVVYVSAVNQTNGQFNYRLMMADADGARPLKVLESKEPILSPTWSPNSKELEVAYVSFEGGRPAIWRHKLRTGEREKLTNFSGLNSAPAWSPDGKRMAMVLSKDGNPDIYIMDLATKNLQQVTAHNISIDTEPEWLADGKSIVFTSNRGGSPQIYQVTLESGAIKRITYEGNYNARAKLIPDGSGIAMVHRQGEDFKIALQSLKNDTIKVLSHTNVSSLDESPTVSLDGAVQLRLPAYDRDVREPAWSPYLETN